jgi:glycopeptide antibiotics resistance protein
MLIRFDGSDFLIWFAILFVLLVILRRSKHNLSYIIFFSIFWIYLLVVVKTVIFPFVINTDFSRPRVLPTINLVPFYFGYCSILKYCVLGIVGNIILTIPFGFGINFLVRIKPRNFFLLALTIGFGFEFSQLVISLIFRSGFRSIDINDVMLNALGVLTGYTLFRAFAWAYIKIAEYFEINQKWIFADIYDVVCQARASDKSKKV